MIDKENSFMYVIISFIIYVFGEFDYHIVIEYSRASN